VCLIVGHVLNLDQKRTAFKDGLKNFLEILQN
jgi:hypothetical protein